MRYYNPPLTAVGPPPPGSHTLQDWRRCLAIFPTVNSLQQNWQLTLLPTHPPPPPLTRPTLFAPNAPHRPQPSHPHHHRPIPPTPPLPRHPPPQPPSPQPCKTARDGRSSHRISGLRIPHTPSARLPTSSSPHTSSDDRRGRSPCHNPCMRTSLSLPLSDASYFHASPNQLSTCTASRTPHTYTSNPHSLSSPSSQASPPRLPTRTHGFPNCLSCTSR